MMGVNKVILVGHVGKDPDFKMTKYGTSMVSFSLATNSKYKDRSGQLVNLTEWHKVQAYGKLAELIKKYVGKGSSLYIEGKLQTSRYEKDGITRTVTGVVVTSVQFLKTEKPSDDLEGSDFEPNETDPWENYSEEEEIPF